MTNVNAPLGFRPLGRSDGAPYAGAIRTYRVANAYATSIFMGDTVKFLTTGVIALAAAGDQFRGVFMGCEYLDSTNKLIKSPYWPASTALFGANLQNSWMKVIDDPNMEFEAQMNAAMTGGQADIGANYRLIAGTGSTGSGLSAQQLDYASLTAAADQWRAIRFLERVDNDPTSAFARVVVVPALHDFRVNTAI